ncbi:MAG: DnaJ C-terminal domain-containing protein [Alphaproteobacteria bacterium]|nr:DnaJ C-terminal domain-containing protein [Alphaproteobacteria bacterium]
MSDDLYDILGVSKDSSQADIRKAYRKLVKELHPDLNPGDKQAEERFKKVSSAYRILNNAEQRARYDRGEIDESGAERPEHQFYRNYADAEADGGERYYSSSGFEDLGDMSDFFSDLFRRRGQSRGTMRIRGQDLRYHLDVDFLDAVNGAKRRITMPDGKLLDLSIPPGTRDGGILRLRGKGGQGIGGGPPGDALVEISVRPHPLFRRENDDIVLDLPVTLDEAVLGGKVEVPTTTGKVMMTIPKGASSGDVLRLRGKGIKGAKGRTGDQRVTIRVVLPDEVDDDLADFMRSWRKSHGYDPRANLRRTA